MTLKEPEDRELSAFADFFREVGDAAARSSPSPRYPKRTKPKEEPQFELFPSPHESAAAQRFLERRANPDAKSPLSFKPDEAGRLQIVSAEHDRDHVAARLVAMDTFATGYFQFSEAMLAHLRSVAVDEWGQFNAGKLEQITAIVQGINPQNETEAMLAVQMAAIHIGTMRAAGALATAGMRDHQQWAGNALAKLGRTFAMQVDTLKNLRLNGSQHIHIYHHRDDDSPRGAFVKREPIPWTKRRKSKKPD